MSDPNMPPPPPPSAPPPGGWQSQPQQPGPPPMGGGMGSQMPSWSANITARGTIAGPAGAALADLPDRIIAWFIDGIILAVIGYILSTITTSILGDNYVFFRGANIVSSIVAAVLLLVISGAYFIGTWTRMNGATIGQRVMKLQVRDAMSGGPMSQQQAINRWLVLGAPFAIWPLTQWSFLGWLLWLAVIGYEVYLLVTTAQSPTRQGFHDNYAKTIVAKVM